MEFAKFRDIIMNSELLSDDQKHRLSSNEGTLSTDQMNAIFALLQKNEEKQKILKEEERELTVDFEETIQDTKKQGAELKKFIDENTNVESHLAAEEILEHFPL